MAARILPGLRPVLLRARPVPARSLRPLLPTTAVAVSRPQFRLYSDLNSAKQQRNTDEEDGPSQSQGSTNGDGAKKSSYQRFKDLTKTYGSYAVLMYLALSAIDYSLSFAFVHAVGVKRLEPYVDRMTYQYRKLRYGQEEADAMEAAHAAEKAKAALQDAADTAAKKEQPWWNNKQLWAEAALAYPIHKILLLPVRAGLTVAWTPKVVNWLRARGWIGAAGTKRAAQEGREFMRAQGQRAMDAAKKARNRVD